MGITDAQRHTAYGQSRPPTMVDRFGVWLGARAADGAARFSDARLADFGCGFHASFSRRRLHEVRSALLVDIALSEDLGSHPNVTAVEGSLPDVLPTLEDGTLDIVVCLSVLEHLVEPQVALDHFHRLLAPGGVVILNVPSWWGKPLLEFAAFRLGVSPAEEMDDHKAYYDPRDLWPMLVRAGFRPSEIRCRRHKFGLNTSAICRVAR
jgi:SAM-dependent methyltransferase